MIFFLDDVNFIAALRLSLPLSPSRRSSFGGVAAHRAYVRPSVSPALSLRALGVN